ncbi:hypothetical protein POTOM_006696 [Populus tomentosa]|uniref:Uncharacterized protein n=1 Tax=Populus tomentosa TaxID=118781 RepID=A0A8X8AY89_POPTO|nr:hypothetical protein POTOM_006696 [Populus tomentosa]
MISFNLEISPPDGALQFQSSRLQPLSSLPAYVALHRQQSKSLLSSIQLKRSHEESVQEGIRFNLLFFKPVLVSYPSIQASEVSDSSYLSLSPTLRDNSGVGIVSSSCLDGYGVDSFEGEEFISGIVFMTSSASMDDINWVFDLIAGVQGPGLMPSDHHEAFPSCSSVFVDRGVAMSMLSYHGFYSPVLDLCVQFWLVLYLTAAVCICTDVCFPEKMELGAMGVNLDMSGVLLGEGFHCLLWGPVWVRLSPLLLGRIIWVWATSTSVEWVSWYAILLAAGWIGKLCFLKLAGIMIEAVSGCSACLGEALSPNTIPSPCSPYELLVLAGRLGEGFRACWGLVWPGLFWPPFTWVLVETTPTMPSTLIPWIPNRLGEALSPPTWATTVAWSSGDDVRIVHYPCVAWIHLGEVLSPKHVAGSCEVTVIGRIILETLPTAAVDLLGWKEIHTSDTAGFWASSQMLFGLLGRL